MNEKNDFLSLLDAARLLSTTPAKLETALENFGFSSYIRNSIERDFMIRQGDLPALRPLLEDGDASQGVA